MKCPKYIGVLFSEEMSGKLKFSFFFHLHHLNNTLTVFLLFLACLQDILFGGFPFIHLVIMGSAQQTFLFLFD